MRVVLSLLLLNMLRMSRAFSPAAAVRSRSRSSSSSSSTIITRLASSSTDAKETAAATPVVITTGPIVNENAYDQCSMDDIVGLCKRRGFIFPSSEIYNGYAGFYDYGPIGAELKKNIKDAWWKHFVQKREDVVGLDSSIIHNPATWESSGECVLC